MDDYELQKRYHPENFDPLFDTERSDYPFGTHRNDIEECCLNRDEEIKTISFDKNGNRHEKSYTVERRTTRFGRRVAKQMHSSGMHEDH